MYTHIKGIRACSWTWWLWPISVDLFFLFLDVPPALSLSPRGLCFFITLLRTLRPNSPVAALTCISCVFFLTPSSFFLDLNPRDNFLMSRCLKKKKMIWYYCFHCSVVTQGSWCLFWSFLWCFQASPPPPGSQPSVQWESHLSWPKPNSSEKKISASSSKVEALIL